MVAGGLPTLQVLLDDGTGSFPYDITTYVRLPQGFSIQRGRQDELSAVTPGSLSLTLDNADGRFTIGSTLIASPSPIKADAKIRIKEIANGTTFTRYTGYVVSWPVAWPSGDDGFSTVALSATDAQARAQRWILRDSGMEEMLADSPWLLFPFNESSGSAKAVDFMGTGLDLFATTSPAPTFDGSKVTFKGNGDDLFGNWGLVQLGGATGSGTIVIGFNLTALPTGGGSGFLFQGILNVDSGGHIKLSTSGVASPGTYIDGQNHVAHYTSSSTGGGVLYIDGVQVATEAVFGYQIQWLTGSNVVGSVWNGAIYNSILSPSRIASQAAAIRNGFNPESGTARISRFAGYGSLPVGTLDSSMTNVSGLATDGMNLWDAVVDTSDAELGIPYFDGTGSLTFHNRNRVPLKASPDFTIDANWCDPATSFLTDMQGVINYYEVIAAGGTGATYVTRDATSESNHGRYPTSKTFRVTTDQEAIDRGNWLVSTHKEPGPRLGGLVLDLLSMTAAQQAQALSLEPDSWLQVTGLPSQTPGGTTANFIVQGFTENLTADTWTLALNVVNKATIYPVFVLDRSALDSGDLLYL